MTTLFTIAAHVPNPLSPRDAIYLRNWGMYESYKRGMTIKQLAESRNLSRERVRQILNLMRYREIAKRQREFRNDVELMYRYPPKAVIHWFNTFGNPFEVLRDHDAKAR